MVTNVIAKVLYYTGIIIAVLGVILGFVFGQIEYAGNHSGILWAGTKYTAALNN